MVVALATTSGVVYLAAGVPPNKPRQVADREEAKSPTRPSRSSNFSRGARIRRQQVFAQVQGAAGFRRLGEPEPGDWLYSFREPGQTLTDYAAQRALNRRTPVRQTLHLLPFSDLQPAQREMLGPIRRHTALFFDTKVQVLPVRAVRRSWYRRQRGQYDADVIVQQLAREVPASSLGLFGLMGSDLYGLGLNFVFGEALLHERAGIYSLRRYGRERAMLIRRSLKLSAHEIGHMFGLRHCVFYECVMNGVNSLEEMDRSPLHLCPVCLGKLQWNLKFDAVQRYRSLGRFYRDAGLETEANFVEARARELQGQR